MNNSGRLIGSCEDRLEVVELSVLKLIGSSFWILRYFHIAQIKRQRCIVFYFQDERSGILIPATLQKHFVFPFNSCLKEQKPMPQEVQNYFCTSECINNYALALL